MKVFILCAIFAAAHAQVLWNGGLGSSVQHSSMDNVGNYKFGYTEGHATGGTFRQESGSPGVKIGSYGLTDADGRQRIVNYIADAAGFRANIKTNEPGVDASKDPAATTINKDLVVAAAAPWQYAAGPVMAAPLGAISYSSAVHHGLVSPLHYGAGLVKAW